MPLFNPAQTFLLCLSLLLAGSAHSQKLRIILVDDKGNEILYNSTRWIQAQQADILKHKMRLSYTKPAILDEVPGDECFKDYPRLEWMLTVTLKK